MSSQSAVNVDVKVAEIVKSLKRDGKALQDHQIVGIKRMLEWANDDHGGILADEMGLGKTCQSICVLRALLDDQLFTKQGRKDKKKLINRKFGLILCPLSVLDHWKLEIERFGGDQVKAFCYYGIDTEREKMRKEMQKDKSWNILLAPYHRLYKLTTRTTPKSTFRLTPSSSMKPTRLRTQRASFTTLSLRKRHVATPSS
ncbi:hypothetical protein L596_013785 [Steinernema carpocapsae]|uniref:SNF2 N-terminal domain-containing protein n=1 Tax=Steinernema carpocapsae TaxID=34508 RepID=A0A4U5P169_STECR|nr:hypothetical protein L596_013785 [Steinernema carpocapsae]